MSSEELNCFINKFNSEKIGILYDCGNAVRYNFSFKEDFKIIGNKIKEIHFKDYSNKLKKSVRLGTGNTNFFEIYSTLKKFKWVGPIIFETPIMNNWEIEAKENLNYAKEILEKIYL